uniref:UBA domain-containing protein n=1 Tax=Syphacia muris TaxID=451379 RepID=A0A0N5AW52_9BILA
MQACDLFVRVTALSVVAVGSWQNDVGPGKPVFVKIREVLLIGRLSHATGCSADEALQLLRDNNWQLEAAISAWFTPSESPLTVCLPMYHAQSASQQIPQVTSQQHQALCPCNTPATPASFTDTIHAFQKMDWWDNFSDE